MNCDASIIVPCKGRLCHLRQTISSMIDQGFDGTHEVVVVDYGCPDGTAAWLDGLCDALRPRNLRYIQVKHGTALFNLSRARNCGAVACDSRWLAFVDADCKLARRWLQTMVDLLLANDAVLCRMKYRARQAGNCVVLAEAFHRVRGYDEQLRGWGHEDNDLYLRLEQIGKSVVFSQAGLLTHIRHEQTSSTQHYLEKTPLRSWRRNRRITRKRDARGEQVNPNGYGVDTEDGR